MLYKCNKLLRSVVESLLELGFRVGPLMKFDQRGCTLFQHHML